MKRIQSRVGLVLRLLASLGLTLILLGMAGRPPLVGGPAPDFQLASLKGEPSAISDYRGQVVLLNFWATWCEPCKKEMPEMQAAYAAYKDEGFVVLALNFGEEKEAVEAVVKKMGLTFPVLLDKKVKVAERHNVVSLPVSFFIDPKGVIKEQVFGGTLTKAQIGEIFQRLTAEAE